MSPIWLFEVIFTPKVFTLDLGGGARFVPELGGRGLQPGRIPRSVLLTGPRVFIRPEGSSGPLGTVFPFIPCVEDRDGCVTLRL